MCVDKWRQVGILRMGDSDRQRRAKGIPFIIGGRELGKGWSLKRSNIDGEKIWPIRGYLMIYRGPGLLAVV
jgi:hypothetical protein